MIIKVAISGSHDTGKTVLANSIYETLRGCAIIYEVAGECPYPINKETTSKAQLYKRKI